MSVIIKCNVRADGCVTHSDTGPAGAGVGNSAGDVVRQTTPGQGRGLEIDLTHLHPSPGVVWLGSQLEGRHWEFVSW